MKGPNPFAVQNRPFLAPLGRKQLFEKASKWLQQPGNAVAYIGGVVGSGKSFMLAWMREHARYELYLDIVTTANRSTELKELVRSISYKTLVLSEERFAPHLSIREQQFFEKLKGKEIRVIAQAMNERFAKPPFKLFIAIDSADEPAKEIMSWIEETMGKFPCELKIAIVQKNPPPDAKPVFYMREPSQESFESWVQDTLKASKISAGTEAIREVYYAGSGIPLILMETLFCMYARLPEREQILTKNLFLKSKTAALDELAEVFDKLYSSATSLEKQTLAVLARHKESMQAREIQKMAHITQGILSKMLERLVQKECIQKVERGKYRILCPLFGDYVLERMEGE